MTKGKMERLDLLGSFGGDLLQQEPLGGGDDEGWGAEIV